MNVYVFPSKSVENIKRGIQHQKWAIAPVRTARVHRNRRSKAAQMPIPSRGLFYCSDPRDQFFTSPFIITSPPVDRKEEGIWDQAWVLPFTIKPIGDLSFRLSRREAAEKWPFYRDAHNRGFVVGPLGVFVPVSIDDEEWNWLLVALGVVPPELFETAFSN